MNTKSNHITVSGITVEVVRKAIKNLHLGVYPPNGRVRVAAPTAMSDEAIRLAVIGKLGWIRKRQTGFANQERQSPREYITGETHYYRGKRYRLNVVYQNGQAMVNISSLSTINLYVQAGSDTARRERVLYDWYRSRLKEMIPELLEKWERIIGVQTVAWGVKRMKTKWGTCNIKSQRIWLNLELVKKPNHCLEYIIAHELVHLLERHHNDRFTALMDQFMPLWRQYRDELNRAPLEHGEWEY
ncbi:MAG: M48 family metallopeptidase [Geobacteraceae bacterium]